ncbi:MAG: hypothetical protein LBD17_02340 [Endomicrobium sp.]|nr:hypothetical protein [Endomicrobium sp.]
MELKEAILYAFKKLGKRELSTTQITEEVREVVDFNELEINNLKKKVDSFLNRNSNSKRNQVFAKVLNPKTKRPRRGVYTIKKEKKAALPIKPDKKVNTQQPSIQGLFPDDKNDSSNKNRKATPSKSNTSFSNTDGINTSFLGTAGEYAVVSELLMRGYTAGIMTVDDGIDVSAFKDDKFFLIQVKTTWFNDDKIVTSIKTDRFTKNNSANIFYIIVFRYISSNAYVNRYLIFTSSDIERLAFEKLISTGSTKVNLNIKIKQANGHLYIYNGINEQSIDYNLDNFGLLR